MHSIRVGFLLFLSSLLTVSGSASFLDSASSSSSSFSSSSSGSFSDSSSGSSSSSGSFDGGGWHLTTRNGVHYLVPDGYVFQKALGKGSFGRTYLVESHSHLNVFAIKQMNPKSSLDSHRAVREAFLNHTYSEHAPECVLFDTVALASGVTRVVTHSGSEVFFVIVMKPYQQNLVSLMSQFPMSISQIVDMLSQISFQLAFRHKSMGVAHRDIKPENILVRDDGTYTLADDGAACSPKIESAQDSLLEPLAKETQWYRSPEMSAFMKWYGSKGRIQDRPRYPGLESDIFSLGCVVAEAIIAYSNALELSMKSFKSQNIRDLKFEASFRDAYNKRSGHFPLFNCHAGDELHVQKLYQFYRRTWEKTKIGRAFRVIKELGISDEFEAVNRLEGLTSSMLQKDRKVRPSAFDISQAMGTLPEELDDIPDFELPSLSKALSTVEQYRKTLEGSLVGESKMEDFLPAMPLSIVVREDGSGSDSSSSRSSGLPGVILHTPPPLERVVAWRGPSASIGDAHAGAGAGAVAGAAQNVSMAPSHSQLALGGGADAVAALFLKLGP